MLGAYAVLAHELLEVQRGGADGGLLQLLHLLPQAAPVQGRHVLQQVFLRTGRFRVEGSGFRVRVEGLGVGWCSVNLDRGAGSLCINTGCTAGMYSSRFFCTPARDVGRYIINMGTGPKYFTHTQHCGRLS